MNWAWVVVGVALGVLLPIQPAVNNRLAEASGSAWWSALVNFAVGLILLVVAAVSMRLPTPQGAKLAALPWWAWVGGVIGAVFVAGATYLVPKVGTAVFLGCAVAGQMAASLVIDHFGLMGLEARPVSLLRVGGVVLLAAGVGLVKMG